VRQAITAPDVEMVAEAATAEEALQLAPQIRPDVLLVDIDLPGMDGVGLVRELAPRLPETRIVMLTVSSADHHLLDAMRYGARGYLTKDLSPEALLRAVRSAYDGELAMPRGLAARLVHRLLAEGLTDREIAGSLTISPRTVETHVSSVLHKLGARNRAEAARRYHEPG
jgi:DNA-binding NarL/FixJ family response regulator